MPTWSSVWHTDASWVWELSSRSSQRTVSSLHPPASQASGPAAAPQPQPLPSSPSEAPELRLLTSPFQLLPWFSTSPVPRGPHSTAQPSTSPQTRCVQNKHKLGKGQRSFRYQKVVFKNYKHWENYQVARESQKNPAGVQSLTSFTFHRRPGSAIWNISRTFLSISPVSAGPWDTFSVVEVLP